VRGAARSAGERLSRRGAAGRRRAGSVAGATKAAGGIVARACRIRGAGIFVEWWWRKGRNVTGEAVGIVVGLKVVRVVEGVDVGLLIGTRTAQRQLRARVLARYAMKKPPKNGTRPPCCQQPTQFIPQTEVAPNINNVIDGRDRQLQSRRGHVGTHYGSRRKFLRAARYGSPCTTAHFAGRRQ
jgi:hypothetical protein